MKRAQLGLGLTLTWLTLIPTLSPSLPAQDKAVAKSAEKVAAKEVPSTEEILASYVKALGGKEKLASVQSLVTHGTLSIPAAGIKGDVIMKQSSAGKFRMSVLMPGIADSQSGSDGKTIWELSSVTGPEILTGSRADQSKLQMSLFPSLDMGRHFESMESTGKETFADEECYTVVFRNKDAKPMTTYYSVKTGLEKGNRMTASTSMGELSLTSVVKSYLEQDGIKFASEVEVSLPNGMKQIMTIEKVEINTAIEPSAFALPPEIEALSKK